MIKPEFRFGSKVQQWNKQEVIADLKKVFTKKQKAMFRRTPFGHFLDLPSTAWQAQLVHSVLMREVHQEKEEFEFWFKLGDKVVRFSISEFGLITG